MKNIIYTFIANERKSPCQFCWSNTASIGDVIARNTETNERLSSSHICAKHKIQLDNEDFDDEELKQCNRCGALIDVDDDYDECNCRSKIKSLVKSWPQEESTQVKLEKQIHQLFAEKEQLEEDVEIAISALTPAQNLGKIQADAKLTEENKTLRTRIAELEEQLRRSNLKDHEVDGEAKIVQINSYPFNKGNK